MHVHCPHCKNPIEVVDLATPGEITCAGCGSSFRLEDVGTAAWDEFTGKRFGRFEVVGTLGRGAFGTVLKARDPELDRTVALKIPRPGNVGHGQQDLDRFLREARAVAQLRFPSIITIHEVGADDGTPYLVCDFVEGVTLADLLSARRPTFQEAATLIAQVADALHYAHSLGVVHRDIKPSNIMIRPDGSPCVMDFGLAKREAGEITMTIDGQVLGTPAYMSPEQARGEGHRVDGKSDVYGLGVILYQLLTGELPFRGNSRMLLYQVLHDEPKPPRRLNDRIPRDLETITVKAMAKEPGKRYASAKEMADDLRRFLAGEPIAARPVGALEKLWRWSRRQPLVAGLTAAVAVLLVAGTTVSTYFAIDATLARDRADTEALKADNKATEAAASARKEALERKKAVQQRNRAEREADAAWANQYIAHVTRMESDWESGNVARILDALNIYRQPSLDRKDLRGWEWYYQERLCTPEIRTLSRHTEQVQAVAFSPDGTRLASAGSPDGTVRLWEVGSGQELHILKGHKGAVRSLAFGPDGTRLASASLDGTVKLWDVASGQELRTLNGHRSRVWSVALSPDGTRLASASSDRTVKLWDVASGQEVRNLIGHGSMVQNVAFSPDGTRLASASSDRTVKLWDVASGQELRTLSGHTASVRSVAFSPDGAQLASVGNDGMVKLWDAASGQHLSTLMGHTDWVISVMFSPDGTRLVSASLDRTVRLWDAVSGQQLRIVKGKVSSVVFSPDGAWLASAGEDRTVKLWNTASGQEFRTITGRTSRFANVASGQRALSPGGILPFAFNPVAFSPDGARMASTAGAGMVKLWDTASGQELRTLKGHTGYIASLAFSPDGTWLASASKDQTVLWDAATGKQVRTLTGHTASIEPGSLAFSRDGARLALGSVDGTVTVWQAATGQELQTLKGHSKRVASVALSPDGAWLASAGYDGMVKLWDAASGQELRMLKGHSNKVGSVAFSPDGVWIASASVDTTVKLWEAASGQELRTLKHNDGVWSLAFSPDGARLASASVGGTVKVWHVASGQEVRTLAGYKLDGYHVAFAPNGHWLAVTSSHGVRLYDARPLTPEVQAEVQAVALLDLLFPKPLPTTAVRAAIQRDKIIGEPARQKALELAERFKEETDPKTYYDAAWPVLRHPYSNAFVSEFALAQMKAACTRDATNTRYPIALGVAQYRLGRFQKEQYGEALVTLAKCDQDQPATLAFLAMARHQLVKAGWKPAPQEEPKTALARLRELMKHAHWAKDREALTFQAEADRLIRPRATEAKE